jgi:hypothetical protein
MLKKLVVVLALVTSLLIPVNANAAEDYLLSVDMNRITNWNNDDSKLVPKFAQIEQVRYRIPTSNPDKLIGQIVLTYPLSDRQMLYDNKWNLGLWIYGQAVNCLSNDNCEFILLVRAKYPKSTSISTWVKSYKTETQITSDCPASSAVEDTPEGKTLITYSLSISCLNIPSSFASYAFTSYEMGLPSEPFGFTSGGYVDNPYHQLAKKAYEANGGKSGLSRAFTSAQVAKLESTIASARTSFDNMNTRFDSLAPEIKKKLNANKDWKNFQKLETQLSDFEDQVVNQALSDAEASTIVPKIIKLINSQISGLNAVLKIIPKYQCYNEIKDLTTILNKSNSCPKGYAKVKT